MARAQTVEVDALIVGGGPVGLMLAVGLQAKNLKVKVLEKCNQVSSDWSAIYTYRVDARGQQTFKQLGLFDQLAAVGVATTGFDGTEWLHDGTKIYRKAHAEMSLGYSIQRPALCKILTDALAADTIIDGELLHADFQEGTVYANARLGTNEQIVVRSSLLFGCDGARSAVKAALAAHSEELARDFTTQVLNTPSTGLLYKAVLYKPPEDLSPDTSYRIKGKSGKSLTMLRGQGRPGDLRPLQAALPADDLLYSFQDVPSLRRYLQEEFPQLEVNDRLSEASAEAWCKVSGGTTFPHARWCNKASAFVGGVGVALLGDALHCFPPDLGQGVNAGSVDVKCLLDLWPASDTWKQNGAVMQECLGRYNALQAPEAEAICKLIPVGMPYQYGNPAQKFKSCLFMGDFLCRLLAWKLAPSFFSAPAVMQVNQVPPPKYADILRKHRSNTLRLRVVLAGLMAVLLAALKRRRS